MGLREQIAQPADWKEVVVEHAGEKYLFRGMPDANVFASTLLLPPEKIRMNAEHWQRVLGQHVNEDIVKHVFIVHSTLVSKEWDAKEKTWVDVPAYDITDVAKFASTNGPCFLKMLTAAFEVLGLTADGESKSQFDQVAAGNSGEPADTN